MGLYFQDYENGTWEYTNDDNYIKAYQCIQEVLVWRGESSFDIELGIDYDEIFDSNSFLTAQLEEILDKYRLFFSAIFQNVERVDDSFVITLQFIFSSVSTNPLSINSTQQTQAQALSVSLKYTNGGFDVSVK